MSQPLARIYPRGTGGRTACGLFCLLATWAAPAPADGNRLTRLDVVERADGTRLILDFSAAPVYRLVRWTEPDRLRLDFTDTRLAAPVRQPPESHASVGRVEATEKPGGGLLLSVALEGKPKHRVSLTPAGHRQRLTIELLGTAAYGAARTEAAHPSAVPQTRAKPGPSGRRVVAIDAGHGGKDTGAIGPGGHYEKDIVLSIARRLAGFIRAEPGLQPALVRRDDRFVPLRTRMALARAAHADLLVSLHADADSSGQVRGMSVYTLSERGASHEAGRWLARRGKGMALAGSLNLRDKEDALARTLLDLCQRATLADSERAAAAILREVQKRFPIHHHQVQRAGFVVLKSPDIPSVLVETGFISHPVGEKDLSSPAHQDQIARTLFYGIRRYFAATSRGRPAGRIADSTP